MTPTTPAPITSGDALKIEVNAYCNDLLDCAAAAELKNPREAGEIRQAVSGIRAALATRATDVPAQGAILTPEEIGPGARLNQNLVLSAPAQAEQVQVPSGERETFEAYASDNGQWPAAIERNANGTYKLMQTAQAWAVWEYRAALAQRAGAADKPAATVIKKGADRQWMSENLGSLPDGLYSLYLATLAATADAAPAGAVAVRNAALEEAALACMDWGDELVLKWQNDEEMFTNAKARAWDGIQCAARIRALKSAAAEVTPAPQCNLSASSLEVQGCKEVAPAEGDPHVNSLFHRMQAAAGIMSGPASTLDEMAEYIIDALQNKPGAPATAAASVPDGGAA